MPSLKVIGPWIREAIRPWMFYDVLVISPLKQMAQQDNLNCLLIHMEKPIALVSFLTFEP